MVPGKRERSKHANDSEGIMGQQKKTQSQWLGETADATAIADAIGQIGQGLKALRVAMQQEAKDLSDVAVDQLRSGLMRAEENLEWLIASVPGVGPSMALKMHQVTHTDESADEMPTRPSNVEDMSPHIEPGGVASKEYLEYIGA